MDLSVLELNGTKHSVEFHIDSSFRDRTLFPNPNKYTIEFIQNFNNVIAVDIVDARIPKTEYVINNNNNKLVIHFVNRNIIKEYYITIGDYSHDQLIIKFNEIVKEITLNLFENTHQFVFKSSESFKIDLENTTLNKVIGFDEYTNTNTFVSALKDPTQYIHTTYQSLTNNVTYIESELDKIYINEIQLNEHSDIPNKIYYLNKIGIPRMETISSYNFENNVYFVINITNKDGVVLSSISQQSNVFVFEDVQLEYNEKYYIQLNFRRWKWYDTQLIKIPVQNTNPTFVNKVTMKSPNALENKYAMLDGFGIDMEIIVEERVYSIISPGRFNLFGDPYIVLRCKELDSRISNGIRTHKSAFLFGTVIRLCELGSIEERYVSNTKYPIEFTPINKLSRLSFTFENLDGTMYDFKGFNHNFTIRLYHLIMKSNVTHPFIEQKFSTEIEAMNEQFQYFEV